MARSHQIDLAPHARGHLVSTRERAIPVRERVEAALTHGAEVVLDFSSVEVTQAFIDELIGALILRHGPSVLDCLIFRSCSDNARAIIEFVVADRCDQHDKARLDAKLRGSA